MTLTAILRLPSLAAPTLSFLVGLNVRPALGRWIEEPSWREYFRSVGQAVLDNPRSILPLTGRPRPKGRPEYAEFAGRTPHVVVSRTLQQVS